MFHKLHFRRISIEVPTTSQLKEGPVVKHCLHGHCYVRTEMVAFVWNSLKKTQHACFCFSFKRTSFQCTQWCHLFKKLKTRAQSVYPRLTNGWLILCSDPPVPQQGWPSPKIQPQISFLRTSLKSLRWRNLKELAAIMY